MSSEVGPGKMRDFNAIKNFERLVMRDLCGCDGVASHYEHPKYAEAKYWIDKIALEAYRLGERGAKP